MSFIREGLSGNLAIYLTEPTIGSNTSQIEISNTNVLLAGERVFIGGNTGVRPAYFQIAESLAMGNVLNLGGNVDSIVGFMANTSGIYFNNGSGIYTSVGSGGGGGGPATNAGPGLFIDSNSNLALAYNPTYLTLDTFNNVTVKSDSLTLDRLDPAIRYLTLGTTALYLGNTYTDLSNLTLNNTNIGISNPQYGRFIDLQVDSNIQAGYLLATDATVNSNLETGNLVVTSNIQAGYLLATNANITSNLGTGNLVVTSNIQAGYLLATDASITSNLGTGNLVVNSNLQAGYLLATNATIASNLETGNLVVNSNLQAGYLLATNATITSNLETGNLTVNSNLQAGYLLATNADITSNLETGNLVVNSNLNAGTVTSPLGQFTEIQVANHAHLANASTSGYLTVQGNLTVYGSATITNNLFVTGNIFSINSNIVSFNDVALFLAANTISDDGLDRGVFFHYYDTPASNVLTGFYGYDVSESKFAFSNNVNPEQAHVNVFTPFGPYASIKSGNVVVYDVTPKMDLQDYSSGNTSTLQTTGDGTLAITATAGNIRLTPGNTAYNVNMYGQVGIYNNQNNTVAASVVYTTVSDNVYINFGSTASSAVFGESGYGIRSNLNGVLESKSSGGSWQAIESVIQAGSGLTRSLQTISANPDNSTIEVNGSNELQVKSGGITNAKLANSTITIGSNTLALGSSIPGLDLASSYGYLTSNLSGTLTNSQLANNTITIGSNTLALGSSIPGLDLASSFGYLTANLVGSVVNSQLANNTITIGSNTITLGSPIPGLGLASSFGYLTANLVGSVVNSQLANTGILLAGTTYSLGSVYSNIAVLGSNAVTFGTAGDNYIRSAAASNLDILAKENLNLTANTDIILTTNTASTIKLLGPGGQINILPNTTPYINFTSTSGDSGIGIRATSTGIMQFKNTAGTWSNIGSGSGSGSAAGANTNIQYNDGGAFGGSSTLTFDKLTNLLTLAGNALVSTTGELRFRDTTSKLSSSATGNLEIQCSNAVIGTHLIAANTFNTMLYTNSALTDVSTTLSVALDFNMASNFLITMAANASITLNNPYNTLRRGQQGAIYVRTPLTGGGHSLQWYRNSVDSAWFFPSGSSGYAPAVSLGLNTYDVFSYLVVEAGASPKILVMDATGFTRYS